MASVPSKVAASTKDSEDGTGFADRSLMGSGRMPGLLQAPPSPERCDQAEEQDGVECSVLGPVQDSE